MALNPGLGNNEVARSVHTASFSYSEHPSGQYANRRSPKQAAVDELG